MDLYEKALKIMEEKCGQCKEEVIALATISLNPSDEGKPSPAVRMVCAYYEDGVFYISTDAKKNKMLEIEQNSEVAVCGNGWYSFHGIAENLGWVKDEKNSKIREKFKKVFDWFDEVGDEDNPDSIVLKVTLTNGVIIDHERKYGSTEYKIDFTKKDAK